MSTVAAWLSLVGCPAPPVEYPMTGTVVEVRPPDVVVVDHDLIPGFMDRMVMPFTVAVPELVAEVRPGDRVRGQLVVERRRSYLRSLVVVGAADAPPVLAPGEAVPVGAVFPGIDVPLASGATVRIGQQQQGSWVVTFFYTRCPLPEYCPLIATRLAELQRTLPPSARILAITLDPEHDTKAVLRDYAVSVGAEPARWDFGRVPPEVLRGVTEKAGIGATGGGKLSIVHELVLLVLGTGGRTNARFEHMNWTTAEVLERL